MNPAPRIILTNPEQRRPAPLARERLAAIASGTVRADHMTMTDQTKPLGRRLALYIQTPGTPGGPCFADTIDGCDHSWCESQRRWANMLCGICREVIGYQAEFYCQNDGQVAHRACVESQAARLQGRMTDDARAAAGIGPDGVVAAPLQHGVNCEKVEHGNREGLLHMADHDGPYDVDGVRYCGRCHYAL